jgi:hypothetical protein
MGTKVRDSRCDSPHDRHIAVVGKFGELRVVIWENSK